MNERDQFALAAMQAFVSGSLSGRAGGDMKMKYFEIAEMAYALADAMMARREERK